MVPLTSPWPRLWWEHVVSLPNLRPALSKCLWGVIAKGKKQGFYFCAYHSQNASKLPSQISITFSTEVQLVSASSNHSCDAKEQRISIVRNDIYENMFHLSLLYRCSMLFMSSTVTNAYSSSRWITVFLTLVLEVQWITTRCSVSGQTWVYHGTDTTTLKQPTYTLLNCSRTASYQEAGA